MGRVKVRTNFYSVPVRAGLEVQARVYAGYCGDLARGTMRSPVMSAATAGIRRFSTWSTTWNRWKRKPGALAGSKPLEQWRQKGRWPASLRSDLEPTECSATGDRTARGG